MKTVVIVIGDAKNEEVAATAQYLALELKNSVEVRAIQCENMQNTLDSKMLLELYRDPSIARGCIMRMRECSGAHLAIVVAPYGAESAFWLGYASRVGMPVILYSPARAPMVAVPVFAFTSDCDKVVTITRELVRRRHASPMAQELEKEEEADAKAFPEPEDEERANASLDETPPESEDDPSLSYESMIENEEEKG